LYVCDWGLFGELGTVGSGSPFEFKRIKTQIIEKNVDIFPNNTQSWRKLELVRKK